MTSFRSSANEAAQALLHDESLSRSTLWTHFVAAFPEAPGLFPVGVTEVPHEMVCIPAKALSRAAGNIDACANSPWVFDASHTSAPGDEDLAVSEQDQEALDGVVREGLRTWALQLRRTGFPASEFPRAAQIYIDVLTELLGHPVDDELADAIHRGASTMQEASEKADLDGIPPASAAQVMSVTEASASAGSASATATRIVRLEASTPIKYASGQVIPVMQANRQGVWHSLAPALPPNELGQLEFHVRDELDVEVGDHVTLGTAYGPVPFPANDGAAASRERVALVADGTGLAAAKAMLFELMERAHKPQVELIIGVEHEDEFYDLPTIAALASSAAARDWLTVTCVAEQVMDPESAEAPAVCDGLRRVWVGLETLVSATGTWWGRRLILCGSTARCTLLSDALREAGAPAPLVIAPDAEPEWFDAKLA